MWAANFFSTQPGEVRLFGPKGFFSPDLQARQVYAGWFLRNGLEAIIRHRR